MDIPTCLPRKAPLPEELKDLAPETVALLSSHDAMRYQAVPRLKTDDGLVLAVAKNDIGTLDALSLLLQDKGISRVELEEYPPQVIQTALLQYYGVNTLPPSETLG